MSVVVVWLLDWCCGVSRELDSAYDGEIVTRTIKSLVEELFGRLARMVCFNIGVRLRSVKGVRV